jgi:hypothetical protein
MVKLSEKPASERTLRLATIPRREANHSRIGCDKQTACREAVLPAFFAIGASSSASEQDTVSYR